MDLDFSVVIPAHGRPAQLASCMEALTRQDYDSRRFEVVVVDDGSDSPIAPYRGALNARVLRQANAGPAAARNTGAAAARGRWLAFTDDDCTPAPDWLAVLGEVLRAEPAAMVGGRTENVLTRDACATASQLLVSYLYEYYNTGRGGARFFTSNNIALSAERFREIGGFDVGYRGAAGEDRQFCEDWRRRGWPMRYAPGAVVRHAHALTLRKFWRQQFNYGRAAHHFHIKRAALAGGAVRVEPWSFYGRLLWYPVTVRHQKPIRQAALLLVSQVANASGFFRERLAAR